MYVDASGLHTDSVQLRVTAQVGCLGLRVVGHPALSLHSSNKQVNLSWFCLDDSTINIIVVFVVVTRISVVIMDEPAVGVMVIL